jgi:hypothetical protein
MTDHGPNGCPSGLPEDTQKTLRHGPPQPLDSRRPFLAISFSQEIDDFERPADSLLRARLEPTRCYADLQGFGWLCPALPPLANHKGLQRFALGSALLALARFVMPRATGSGGSVPRTRHRNLRPKAPGLNVYYRRPSVASPDTKIQPFDSPRTSNPIVALLIPADTGYDRAIPAA